MIIRQCPDHQVSMVYSDLYNVIICPEVKCQWMYGPLSRGSFVIEAEIVRSEELRTERLGPDENDLLPDRQNSEEIRPSKSF